MLLGPERLRVEIEAKLLMGRRNILRPKRLVTPLKIPGLKPSIAECLKLFSNLMKYWTSARRLMKFHVSALLLSSIIMKLETRPGLWIKSLIPCR